MLAGYFEKYMIDHGWLAKITSSGKVTQQRTYSIAGESVGFEAVRQFSNGSYVFAGYSHTDEIETRYSDAALLMTTDSKGLTTPTVKPKTYKAKVTSIRLDEAPPTLAVSRGQAKARATNFSVADITTLLQEKNW